MLRCQASQETREISQGQQEKEKIVQDLIFEWLRRGTVVLCTELENRKDFTENLINYH